MSVEMPSSDLLSSADFLAALGYAKALARTAEEVSLSPTRLLLGLWIAAQRNQELCEVLTQACPSESWTAVSRLAAEQLAMPVDDILPVTEKMAIDAALKQALAQFGHASIADLLVGLIPLALNPGGSVSGEENPAGVSRATEARPSGISHKVVATFMARAMVERYRAVRNRVDRPALIIIEDRFDTFEMPLAAALASELQFSEDLPLPREEALPASTGHVWFWSRLSSAQEKEGFYAVFDMTVRALGAGGDVLLVCDQRSLVPNRLLELAVDVLTVPRFSAELLREICASQFGDKMESGSEPLPWARLLVPEDLLIVGNVEVAPLAHIHAAVSRRLAAYRSDDARALETLYAFGEARDWAQVWAEDVRAIASGSATLSWNDVEHGALLIGRHGMGKTGFAKSLAKAAGLHLVQIDMPDEDEKWENALRYLRAGWEQAKAISPSILLIESGHAALDPIAFMFDEFDADEPVFVLVTHLNHRIPPNLLKAGRLERVFEIPYPTARVLKEVFAPLLAASGANLSGADLEELARNAQGNVHSLAQAEQVVAQAKRAARRKGTTLALKELMVEVYGGPGVLAPKFARSTIEDTAFHEAGHAVMMLLSRRGLREITYLSVVPKNDYLGVTRSWSDETDPDVTRQDLVEQVRMMLGGRAAEEIKNGRDGISTGPSSDLENATWLVSTMFTRYGFGERGSLVSWEPDLTRNEALRHEIEKFLGEQYEVTLATLKEHWVLVKKLVAAVMEKEEITGEEMRKLLAEYRGA
jgi:cell division protease FtsH